MVKHTKTENKHEPQKVVLNTKDKGILIEHLSVENEEVFNFLEDKPNKEEWVRKAVIVGIIGLKNMGLEMKVDYVDKRFKDFLIQVQNKFKEQGDNLQDKLDAVFDVKNSESPIAKLYAKIEETFDEDNKKSPMYKLAKHLEDYFDDDKGIVRGLINDTFDVKKKDSPIGNFMRELENYFDPDRGILKKMLEDNFDTTDEKTPLGALLSNMNYYFDEDCGVIKKLLDAHFDLDDKKSSLSLFAKQLEENFDVDKGTIKKILDPNTEGMPINLLKVEIMKQLSDVQTRLTELKTAEGYIEKTTLKGGRFEDSISELLAHITNQFGDEVKYVGDTRGINGKTGDFCIHLRENGEEKIVVEAKDSASYSAPKTKNEIEEAIENRRAEFGIFVFKNQDQMPTAIQPVRIERNYIITSVEGNGLYFAYRVARLILESKRNGKEGGIPVAEIESEINFLIIRSKIIEGVIKQATSITRESEKIKEVLVPFQTDIEKCLTKVQSCLKSNK